MISTVPTLTNKPVCLTQTGHVHINRRLNHLQSRKEKGSTAVSHISISSTKQPITDSSVWKSFGNSSWMYCVVSTRIENKSATICWDPTRPTCAGDTNALGGRLQGKLLKFCCLTDSKVSKTKKNFNQTKIVAIWV